jgi:hypothetical protein
MPYHTKNQTKIYKQTNGSSRAIVAVSFSLLWREKKAKAPKEIKRERHPSQPCHPDIIHGEVPIYELMSCFA